MKKLFTNSSLVATLAVAFLSCTMQDEWKETHTDSMLKIEAQLVSSSAWTTRAANDRVEYGKSTEMGNGEYVITAQKEDWNADVSETDTTNAPLTRGTPITAVSGIKPLRINLYRTGTNSWHNLTQPTHVFKATYSGGAFTTSPAYNWPTDASFKHSLFIYSPEPSGTNGLSEKTYPHQIDYTVPTAVGDQPDFCVAPADKDVINNDGTQHVRNIALQHRLTAVGFSVLGWNIKITKITVSDVYVSGTYDMNSSTWDLGALGSREVGVTGNLLQGNWDSNYTNITTTNGYLMMIPQTFPSSATVTIDYTSTATGTQITDKFTARLNDLGITWEAGDKITYNIRTKTAPAIKSGNLTITTHQKGYTTSSQMTVFAESNDNLTFSWDQPWLMIHLGSPLNGNISTGNGAKSPWSTSASSVTSSRSLYFFTTDDNPSTADRTAVITVKGTRSGTKTFNVTQVKAPDISYIPKSVITAAGWTNFRGSKGLEVAMRGNKQKPVTGSVETDDPKMMWKTIDSYTSGVEDDDNHQFGTGKGSTDAMINAGAASHPAAKYCRDMGSEWYLPSRKELELIYAQQALLGPSYKYKISGFSPYWSATQTSSGLAPCVIFDVSPNTSYFRKNQSHYVRCVREI